MPIGYPLLHHEGTLRTGLRPDKQCLASKANKRAISYLVGTVTFAITQAPFSHAGRRK